MNNDYTDYSNNNITKIETSFFKFSIGNNKAIVNIRNIAKIEEYDETKIESVMDSPDFIKGIIDSMDEPITVLDMKKYLNLKDEVAFDEEGQELSDTKKIILIIKRIDPDTKMEQKIGFVSDAIVETIELKLDTAFFEQDTSVVFHKFFPQVAKIDDRFIYKLDVDRVFGDIPMFGNN